jgi:malate dehydrogenase
MKRRVGIIGTGNVGSSLAYNLAMQNICDEILLKDIKEEFTQAIELDISQSCESCNSNISIKAIQKNEDFRDCDIVVITAGIARKPDMSRNDLLLVNSRIMKNIISDIIEYNKNAILIIVANPLDAMVFTALKESKFPRERVLGMAGILDTSRMSNFIRAELKDKSLEIKSLVIGGHGNDMVPLINHSHINNDSLEKYLTITQIDSIICKTKNGGAQIIELLKTGSAYYAPASSTVLMIKAILNDTKEIFPCSLLLDGEYGYKEVVTGVPVKLGKNGCEDIIQLELNEIEESLFNSSVNSVKELINILNNSIL